MLRLLWGRQKDRRFSTSKRESRQATRCGPWGQSTAGPLNLRGLRGCLRIWNSQVQQVWNLIFASQKCHLEVSDGETTVNGENGHPLELGVPNSDATGIPSPILRQAPVICRQLLSRDVLSNISVRQIPWWATEHGLGSCGKIYRRPWCSPPRLQVPVHVPQKKTNFGKKATKIPVDSPFLVD